MKALVLGAALLAAAALAGYGFIRRFTVELPAESRARLPSSRRVNIVVTGILRLPRELEVRFANGGAAGTVRMVWCRTLNTTQARSVFLPVSIPLGRGEAAVRRVSWSHVPGQEVACYADGVDVLGVAQVLTARNGMIAPRF